MLSLYVCMRGGGGGGGVCVGQDKMAVVASGSEKCDLGNSPSGSTQVTQRSPATGKSGGSRRPVRGVKHVNKQL